MNPKVVLETGECTSNSGDEVIGNIFATSKQKLMYLWLSETEKKKNLQNSSHLFFVTEIIKSLQKTFVLKSQTYFQNAMHSYSSLLSPKELECALKA